MKVNETFVVTEESKTPGRLTLPSLVISYFAVWPSAILAGIFLIDIGETFGHPVGVVGQISTAASFATGIAAVLMGVLSVRFNHKLLLMLGLVFTSISAVGSFFALNFTMLFLFFTLSGLGQGMVDSMAFVLVGEQFPLEQRTRAIGWVLTGAGIAAILGPPVIGFIGGLGGWRLPFLGFVLPISLLGLILAAKGIFSPAWGHDSPSKNNEAYLEGFKEVFNNRSSMACLVGAALSSTAWAATTVYSVSFFRERFEASLEFASILIMGIGICYLLGNLNGSLFVTRFGRKPVTVLTIFIGGIFTIFFMNVAHFLLALILVLLGCVFFGMRATGINSLTLEQVPQFRGTIMALNSAAMFMGSGLGAGVGGMILFWSDYEFVGPVLGVIGLIAAFIFYFLTIDPTSTDL